MSLRRCLTVAVGICLIAACAVGPNYKLPKIDPAASYKEAERLEAERAERCA